MNKRIDTKLNKNRDPWLDHLRGAALVSMIGYHACWNMVYLLGFSWSWYGGTGAWIWQQSACWTFLILSGYCWPMGSHPMKKGLITFGAGLLVSAVTAIAMPSARIVCGVLTLLGSAALLMIPLDRVLRRISWKLGLVISSLLFFVFRSVNNGWLGFGLGGPWKGMVLWELPQGLYDMGLFGAWMGFTPKGFFSTDYFSIFPWFFLFCVGYFLRKRTVCVAKNGISSRRIRTAFCERLGRINHGLEWMGRHSLLVYLLHQPVLYGLAVILDYFI